MIPIMAINAWRKVAPWKDSSQVEQDLVITRALIDLFSDELIKSAFAFRGGTALQKIFFRKPTRYSEDIDLVQVRKEKIGPSVNAIRKVLDPWLGKPSWLSKKGRFTIYYCFKSETPPIKTMRLKIEVNNEEQFSVMPLLAKEVTAKNIWFSGSAQVLTYEIEELLGTKMRALYQRKKGRDLYDMMVITRQIEGIDPKRVVNCFQKYLSHQGKSVSRAQFEKNLLEKLQSKNFASDLEPLLREDAESFDFLSSGKEFMDLYLPLLPGEPWKGNKRNK